MKTSTCTNPCCKKIYNITTGSKGLYCSLSCGTTHRNSITTSNKIETYNKSPNKCTYCSSIFDYSKKKLKFCNNKCAAIYNNTARTNKGWKHPSKKIKPIKIKTQKIPKIRKPKSIIDPKSLERICKECNSLHIVKYPSDRKIYCSTACFGKNRGGYRVKSQITKKIHIYNGHKFDSGAEVYFAKLCDKHDIKWDRNIGQYQFIYVDTNNKTRKYYPDFLLIDFNIFIEIKGKRFLNDDTYLKLNSVDRPIKLIMSDKIDQFFKNPSGMGESNSGACYGPRLAIW